MSESNLSTNDYNLDKLRASMHLLHPDISTKSIASMNRDKGYQSLKLLKKVLRNKKDSQEFCDDNFEYLDDILLCGLLLYANHVHYYPLQPKWYDRFEKNSFIISKKLLLETIELMAESHFGLVLRNVFDFILEFDLWMYTDMCGEILKMIIMQKIPVYVVMNKLLQEFEKLLKDHNIENALHLLKIFEFIVVEDANWALATVIDLNPWIRLYHTSLFSKDTTRVKALYKLRVQISMCLKKLLSALTNMELIKTLLVMMPLAFETNLSDDGVLEFGYTLEYAADCQHASFVDLLVEPHFMEYILEKIASNSQVISCMATRIFCRICDYSNNFLIFDTPKTFYIDTSFPIKVGIVDLKAEQLFQQQSIHIRDAVLSAVSKHSGHLTNLRPLMTMLQILMAEIPGGLTSTVVTIICINIQEYAKKAENMPMRQSTHLHASVMGLLTLICWMHRPVNLTKYVLKIQANRFLDAPHLNPPLEITYLSHYYTKYKEEMFFDEWTLRYGLWKRFRCNEIMPHRHVNVYEEKL